MRLILALAVAMSVNIGPGAQLTSSAAISPALDWPMYHSSLARSGVSAETTIGASTAPGLTSAWTKAVGAQLLSSPAVVTNRLLKKTLVYIGTRGSHAPSFIEAFDSATGALVWSHIVGGFIEGSPAVVNGYVYIGTSSRNLYIYNATNGHFVCKFPVTGVIASSPLVVDPDGQGRVVYFGDSGPSGGRADGGAMWAVTAMGNPAGPCRLKWRFDAFGAPPGSLAGQAGVFASPAFGVDPSGRPLIVFGSTDPDNAAYAVDARDGSRVWRFQTKITLDGDIGAAATISAPGVNGFADGVAYVVGKDGVAYALDLVTGSQIWATDLTKIEKKALNSESGPALSGDKLYLGYGGDASPVGGMFSLDAITGALNWDTPSAAIISSPAVSGASGDQVVLAADTAGVMRAYNASDGSVLWQLSTGVTIFSSFAISHGMAFIGGLDGNLYSFKT